MADVYYHVAPQRHRQSIETQGLQSKMPGQADHWDSATNNWLQKMVDQGHVGFGVFVIDDFKAAQKYQEQIQEPTDVYEVSLDAEPEYDVWAQGQGGGRSYRVENSIDPQQIRRVATRISNILDPIHDTLAPEIWDFPGDPEPTFKKQHKDWLINECLTVFHQGGYDGIENYLSFIITGSLTTYQYSDRSDVDTSLFIEFEHFPEWSRAEMIGLMVEELDEVYIPGTPYPLQLFIQPASIKPEDIFKEGLRAGYDLLEEKWLVPPDKTSVMDIEQDMNDTYTYALESADKMDRLIKYEPYKAVLYWHQLHHRRSRDHKAHKGDFAPSNIAYKMIVNRGLTKKLEDITGERIVL